MDKKSQVISTLFCYGDKVYIKKLTNQHTAHNQRNFQYLCSHLSCPILAACDATKHKSYHVLFITNLSIQELTKQNTRWPEDFNL